MNTNNPRSKGVSSVFVAVIFTIALALLIAFIAISIPLAKSYVDKTYWSGQMGIYKPPNPINATNGTPQFNGYCLVNTIGNVTYATCPSTVGNTTIINGVAGMGTGTGTQPPTSPSQPIAVYVDDPYGAGWLITWSGSASGSKSGSTSTSWDITANGVVNLQASVTGTPTGYKSCTITPQSISPGPGGSVLFTINCQIMTGPITVSVTNATLYFQGAGYPIKWQVTWSDTEGLISGSQSGWGSKSWTINNVPYGDVVNFQAQLPQPNNAPQGFTCFIKPSSTSATMGQSVTFTIDCVVQTSPVTVQVNDPYGAGWQVTWSITGPVTASNPTGSQTGSSSASFTINAPAVDTVNLQASITSNPNGYTCTISPQSTSANPGQAVTLTVNCYGSINVNVINDTLGAWWQITWSDTQGKVSGGKAGSSSTSWTISNIPIGDTINFNAQIISNPSGYTCSISPTSASAQAGRSITFAVSCVGQPMGTITVEVTDSYAATSWTITWSDSMGLVKGSKSGGLGTTTWAITVPYGDTVKFNAQVSWISWYGWSSCSITPTTATAGPGQTVSFTVTCETWSWWW